MKFSQKILISLLFSYTATQYLIIRNLKLRCFLFRKSGWKCGINLAEGRIGNENCPIQPKWCVGNRRLPSNQIYHLLFTFLVSFNIFSFVFILILISHTLCICWWYSLHPPPPFFTPPPPSAQMICASTWYTGGAHCTGHWQILMTMMIVMMMAFKKGICQVWYLWLAPL